MTNTQATSILRRLALEYVLGGMADWSHNSSMLAMHWSDARDLRAAATLIEEGQLEEAHFAIGALDLSVHDLIPTSVWDHCSRAAGF